LITPARFVVVVVELGAGIGLPGELERLGDVVVADAVAPRRLAQRAVLVDRLVDDVPTVDLAFVASDDCVDVVAHARHERLAIGGRAVRSLKDPRRRLLMPDERMSDHLHLAIEAELHVAVLCLEGVSIRRRMHELKLEQVLRADLVELFGDEVDGGRVDAVALALVDRHADRHALRHQILERDLLPRGHRGDGDHCGQERSDSDQRFHRVTAPCAPATTSGTVVLTWPKAG
jgi:hypothetical protein